MSQVTISFNGDAIGLVSPEQASVLETLITDPAASKALSNIPKLARMLVLLDKWGFLRLKDRYDNNSPVPVNMLPIDTEKAEREDIARAMAEVNEIKRMISSAGNIADTIGSNFDELARKLGDKMLEEELEKFTQDGVNYVFTVDEYYSVQKENESAAFEWLRKHGVGSIIKETVHHKTLSSTLGSFSKPPEEGEPEELDEKFVLTQYMERLSDEQERLREFIGELASGESPSALDLPPDHLFRKHSVIKAKITKQ